MKISAHEASTAQVGALYPFVSSSALPTGVFVGRDLLGGLFTHDPFELYRVGVITNPNMAVFGQIGRGKSAFVKSYLLRHAALGRRVVVLDPKGEYAPLANALGVTPIELRPGGRICLNPLQVVSQLAGASESRRQRNAVLAAIAGSLLGRLLTPSEHTAVELALAAVTESMPTISNVVAALLDPSEAAARSVATSTDVLRSDGRDVALSLRRLATGELQGMFDGETSSEIDLYASTLVLDLSALYRSPALGAAMACTAAALENAWRSSRTPTLLVIDEAWAVLANVAAARFLQASFKLARANATANITVLHRLSDLAAAGESGSVTERLAQGLLSDCETIVCYAQGDAELETLGRVLGIDERLTRSIARLRRGVALWRVGDRSFLVEHRLSSLERSIVDTDAALLGETSEALKK